MLETVSYENVNNYNFAEMEEWLLFSVHMQKKKCNCHSQNLT